MATSLITSQTSTASGSHVSLFGKLPQPIIGEVMSFLEKEEFETVVILNKSLNSHGIPSAKFIISVSVEKIVNFVIQRFKGIEELLPQTSSLENIRNEFSLNLTNGSVCNLKAIKQQVLSLKSSAVCVLASIDQDFLNSLQGPLSCPFMDDIGLRIGFQKRLSEIVLEENQVQQDIELVELCEDLSVKGFFDWASDIIENEIVAPLNKQRGQLQIVKGLVLHNKIPQAIATTNSIESLKIRYLAHTEICRVLFENDDIDSIVSILKPYPRKYAEDGFCQLGKALAESLLFERASEVANLIQDEDLKKQVFDKIASQKAFFN
ncbi:MAG: hypothetical protein EBZ47_01560 [Chlamydiae bacterium]|nr:hypothetical protein [Chlamydiota bacterium]